MNKHIFTNYDYRLLHHIQEYPRYPQSENIEISEADRDLYVDLRPYSNTAPYTIQETAPVKVRS